MKEWLSLGARRTYPLNCKPLPWLFILRWVHKFFKTH